MSLTSGFRSPLDFEAFFKEGRFPQCSIQESIASYIHLLIITSYGEYEFDPEFGCEVWEYEFEHQQTNRVWVEKIARNIQKMLERYERRLTDIEVKCQISEMEFDSPEPGSMSKRLKSKLNVWLSAKLSATNEAFSFEDNILMSPFSTD